ncbi:MAG TPA: 2-dehydropantoate 2-reductase [Candidatus Limnocylindrales bacterium]|nr:2-dehydropantoate 2-reductase [Candidatus Limnocylindrales bacterium]
MRVAVIGYGAIGHVIERALHGRAELVLVDRTKSPLRDDETEVDAAIVAVKTHGTAWAAGMAKRIVANDGVAITLQNGLGNYEALRDAVGEERAAVGVIYVGARLDESGDLHATGPGRAELGQPAGAVPRERLRALAVALTAGGMAITVVDDPWPSVWRKVVTNAAVNPTTALLGCVNSDLLSDRAASLIADRLAREVARVATASGVPVPDDDAVTWWRQMAELTGANRSSMLQDVEAKRATEVDAICGAVYREGQRRGVEAPLNQAMTLLVSALHP